MIFYPTPSNLIQVFRRHIPKEVKTVLEPAVGEGSLLKAIDCESGNIRIAAVDVDLTKIEALERRSNIQRIHADFLKWSAKCRRRFDLVLANPPFSAKSNQYVFLRKESVPIEVAFFCKAIDLLNDGGCLLAVVPDSIVNSFKLAKYREDALSKGSFRYVYQLPAKTFSSTEGQFYIVVYYKGCSADSIKLRRSETLFRKEIVVNKFDVATNYFRLDYSYYESLNNAALIRRYFECKISTNIGEFCEISRGYVTFNYNKKKNHHSNSFKNGFWKAFVRRKTLKPKYCIAVKRVARNAHLSFGLFPLDSIRNVTDCIILIRPDKKDPLKILFALRVLYSCAHGGRLLLKGTGAKFISTSVLKSVEYLDVAQKFMSDFKFYKRAYMSLDFEKCCEIEAGVRDKLLKKANIKYLDEWKKGNKKSNLKLNIRKEASALS